MLAALLSHPRRSTVVWGVFLLMSAIMVGHNVFLQNWGIGTFPSITTRIEQHAELGYFKSMPLLDAAGKPRYLKYASTPTGRLLHIFPAGLWSVIAPLQVSPTFRAKHRTAHRRLGRLFILMSVSIFIGLVPIVLNGAVGGPPELHTPAIEAAGTVAFGASFLMAGLVAVRHAKNKRLPEHRVWMLRHLALGYSVHMQRLVGHATWWVFPLVVPSCSDLTTEAAQLRAGVFTSYFFIGAALTVGCTEVWIRHTSPSGLVAGQNTPKDR